MQYYDKHGNVCSTRWGAILSGWFSSKPEDGPEIVVDDDDVKIPDGKNTIVIDNETNQLALIDANGNVLKKVPIAKTLVDEAVALQKRLRDIDQRLPSPEVLKDLLHSKELIQSIETIRAEKKKQGKFSKILNILRGK